MSSTRRRVSLRGTNRFAEDPLAQLGLEGEPSHQVDGALEHLCEQPPEPSELEEGRRNLEIDQKIHVARGSGFVACHRSKEVDRLDAERLQQSLGRNETADRFLASHRDPLGGLSPNSPHLAAGLAPSDPNTTSETSSPLTQLGAPRVESHLQRGPPDPTSTY